MTYIRQRGTNEVFAIINGNAYYVDYDYAKKNNVFSQVQEVDYRIDRRYPLAGPVANAPTQSTPTPTSTSTPTPTSASTPTTNPVVSQTTPPTPTTTPTVDLSKVVSIFRDNDNNFYGVDDQGNNLGKLTESQAFSGGLGINATFVQPGQMVSLNQAQTGQTTTSGGSAPSGANSGQSGGSQEGDYVPGRGILQPDGTYQPTQPGDTGGNSGTDNGTGSGTDDSSNGQVSTAYIDYIKELGLWDQLDPATQAFVESAAGILGNQIDQGMLNASVNADLFNQALAKARTDPDILAKYGDALKLNQEDLIRSLGSLGAEYSQGLQQTNVAQDQARKELAGQYAEAGSAFSGFRQKAKEQMATNQQGVIESSRRTLQNQLNTMGRALEQQYGSAGLAQFGNISVGGLNYTPVGGITGTNTASMNADILAKAMQEYNLIAL